jgi:DDE superfamily endonuclease
LIASICADGLSLAPTLIYQGASHDLQDTWLDDFDHVRDQAFFASSENGWSCDLLGQHWLESVFNRTTKQKAKRERRLLLVDGHSSHVNMRFINYADANRILLVVLPPHSTHRLQPLDVGLFSPLATYYSQQIDKLLAESQGLVRLTKRDFWPLFREAWNQAFTMKNVRSAWETTGIHPFNPSKVLSTFIRAEVISQISPKQIKTPVSTRAIRRTFRQLQKEGHVDERAKIMLRAGEKLATELDIVRHENQGLRKAVFHEKKKRKRGKAMNLYDPEENEGQALFFSPAKIARVRQRVADEEQAEHQRKQIASDKKLQAAIARDEKAREAEEKKITRNLARQAAREQLAQEKAERQAVRQAQRAQKAAETAKRKRDAAEAKTQRIRAKEVTQKSAKSKKRSLEVDESERSIKRPRTHASRSRIATNSDDSIIPLDTTVVRLAGDTVSTVNSAQLSNRMRNAEGRPISLPLRSGRNTRLPARFL